MNNRNKVKIQRGKEFLKEVITRQRKKYEGSNEHLQRATGKKHEKYVNDIKAGRFRAPKN